MGNQLQFTGRNVQVKLGTPAVTKQSQELEESMLVDQNEVASHKGRLKILNKRLIVKGRMKVDY